MLEKLTVGLGERSYPIWIGSGTLDSLGGALQAVGFPAGWRWLPIPRWQSSTGSDGARTPRRERFSAAVPIELPDGEEYKNLQTLETAYDLLIGQGFDRSCGLVALGGGVVGDLVGFAAATFLRGIPFAQVPTTLLSQVDSSVGGKTGVNHPLGKNLIGAFYQPRHVHIDVDTLKTLPPREFAAGMAEVIKYGIIRDREFFSWLARHGDKLAGLAPSALVQAVKRSCQIKADVVELDEKESSLRAILNFGHTFGHAVETLAGYGRIRHGEAVAIGMVVAASAACEIGLCTAADVAAIRDLLAAFGLPVSPPSFPLADYLQAMGRDKKVSAGTLRLVLNRGIGDCSIREIRDPEAVFRAALIRVPPR